MEENRRKAIERKRKSMQVLKELNDMEANQQQAIVNTAPATNAAQEENKDNSNKRQKTEDDIAKNICKVVDAH